MSLRSLSASFQSLNYQFSYNREFSSHVFFNSINSWLPQTSNLSFFWVSRRISFLQDCLCDCLIFKNREHDVSNIFDWVFFVVCKLQSAHAGGDGLLDFQVLQCLLRQWNEHSFEVGDFPFQCGCESHCADSLFVGVVNNFT